MFNEFEPTKGSLLVSEPFVLEEIFDRSVILLVQHHLEDGSLGFILNQKTAARVSDVLNSVAFQDFPLYLGGPVAQDRLFFIHRCNDRLEGGVLIAKDIYWGGDMENLYSLVQDKIIQSHEVKFFLGYAGWEPNQLQKEIHQNSWAVHNNYSPLLALKEDGEALWKAALLSMGPKYAHVVNFPSYPELN